MATDDVTAYVNSFVSGGATSSEEHPSKPSTLAPLARVLEGFRVPGAFVGAGARDVQGATHGNVGKLAKALTPDFDKGIIGTPGYYDRAHQALDEYYATDKPNLEAVQKGGGALGTVADAALHHPFATGAVTFGAELLNPLNLATGEALGAGARGLRAAIPAVDRAATAVEGVAKKATAPLANAIGSVTNKFHGVGKASPEFGQSWARGADFTSQSAPHGISDEHVEDIFGQHLPEKMNPIQRAVESATGGMAQTTKREVWRRAERDAEGNMVNAPRDVVEPKYGPSVQQRADKLYGLIGAPVMSDAYRAATADLDAQGRLLLDKMIQHTVAGGERPEILPKALAENADVVHAALDDPFKSIGSLTLKQMQNVPEFKSTTGYLPMKMYGGRPVYGFQNAEDAASAKGGWPRSGFGVTRSKSKVLQGSLDDLEGRAQAGGGQLFADEFDPAFQLRNYVRNAEANVAKAQAVKGLGDVPTVTGENARVDLPFHLPNQPENPIPGSGPEAFARASNFAGRRAKETLTAAAANDIGRPDLAGGMRGLRSVSSTFAKWLEARKAAASAKSIVPGVQDAAARAGAAADPTAALGAFRAAQAKYRTPGAISATSPELERALAARRAGQHVPTSVISTLRQAAAKAANEAADATGTLGRALHGNHATVIRAADRGLGKVEASADRFAARRDGLETAYHDAKATAADRAEIERRVAAGLSAETNRILSTMGGKVPKGYVAEGDLRLGLGADSHGRAIQQDFATYLADAQKAGALPEDAEGVAKTLATLNGLARRMMILVPTVHTVWNLGMGFLSAGGRPHEMAAALAGKIGPDFLGPQLEERFMRSGAASAMNSGSSIGAVRNATTPLSELDPRKATNVRDFLERVGAAGHKITNATVTGPDSRYVFDVVENGYARVLFKRLTSNGLSDGAAAARIRSMLGDYSNITNAEKPLQNLFFFYPWMKTAIKHWTKELANQPGPFFNAPMQGIRSANEIQGDTEDGQIPRSPFSLTVGKTPEGDFRRLALPLPQRYANDVAGMVLGNGDTKANGLYQRTEPVTNLLRGHLNPVAGTLADAVLPGTSKYQRINIDTKSPSPPALQVAGAVADRFAPPVAAIGQNIGDPLGAVAGEAGLGFPSAHLSKDERARQTAITRAYAPAIKAAQEAGNQAEAKRLYLQLQADLKARPTTP